MKWIDDLILLNFYMRIMASNFFILALTFILCGKTGCQNLQVDPSIHTIVIGGGVSGMASAL